LIDLRDASAPAAAVIEALALLPHPEGGHYRETWRDAPPDGTRGAGTAILFLLRVGANAHRLGPTMHADEDLQRLVPQLCWQSAHSLGRWTLCSCIVAPAFSFEGFELAPPGWEPCD
jgi:predicted cupin superfamily sugar epimerase